MLPEELSFSSSHGKFPCSIPVNFFIAHSVVEIRSTLQFIFTKICNPLSIKLSPLLGLRLSFDLPIQIGLANRFVQCLAHTYAKFEH